MIDAYSATPVAFMDDNGIHHLDCLNQTINAEAYQAAKDSGIDRDFYRYLEDEYDITVLIRYNIHEIEAERAYDFEQYELKSVLDELMEDLDETDIEVEWIDDNEYEIKFKVDASAYIETTCDTCYNRIE